MAAPKKHILQQGPVIRSFVRTALSTARKRPAGAAPPVTPSAPIEAMLKPRPQALVDDYLRHIGADPAWYRGTLPAHLWPQWGFPLTAQTLRGVPYDLAKALNGGCTLEIHKPIPVGEPLLVRAWLDSIEDDGSRALLVQKIITGTASAPDALTATLTAFVPLKKREGGGSRDKPTVPEGAREIARQRVKANAGWEFAVLTGDFNPVHWVAPYARMFGFKSTILHGFSTMARSLAAVDKVLLAGDPRPITRVDVRFVRPVTLPGELAVFVHGDELYVGQHAGGPAYMTGAFALREAHNV